MKVFSPLLLSLFSSLILTGCWDRKEINDIAFVISTGIDKESTKYRVTLQIALPGQMGQIGSSGGSGGTGGNKAWLLDSATGNSIREANEIQQLTLSRRLYFSHRRIILLGENMARSGIEPIVNMLPSVPQNRLSSFVLVTKDSARNVMNAQTQIEKFPAEKIRKTIEIWMVSPPNLKQVADSLESHGIDLTLPVVSLSQSNLDYHGKPYEYITINGLAVFHQDKLAGFIEGYPVKGLLLAMNKANHPTLTFRVPRTERTVTLQLREYLTAIKPILQNNKIIMQIDFQSKAYVLGNESNIDLSSENFLHSLEEAANQEAKREIENAVQTVQSKIHSDALGFGDKIFRDHPKEWNDLESKWEQLYPKIPVQVHSEIHIQQTGTVITSLGPKEEELEK